MRSTAIMLLLFGLTLGSTALADGICTGAPGEICFDAGAPDPLRASQIAAYLSADDFVLETAGDDLLLNVEFWTIEFLAAWFGTIEYFIFEDVSNPDRLSGRSPAATPLTARSYESPIPRAARPFLDRVARTKGEGSVGRWVGGSVGLWVRWVVDGNVDCGSDP